MREVSRLFSGALRILYTAAGQPTARCQAVVDRSESEVAALTTYVADGSAQHPFWCGCSPVDRRVLPPASPTFNWTAVGLDCAPGKARDFHICWVQDGKQVCKGGAGLLAPAAGRVCACAAAAAAAARLMSPP